MVIATAISFVVSSAIVRMAKGKSLEEAQEELASRKAQAKGTANVAIASAADVKKVVFACDAGMGSSAMGATKFRNRVKALRPDLTVITQPVRSLSG